MGKCPKNVRIKYQQALVQEANRLEHPIHPKLFDADLVFNITKYIMEVAESSKVLRSGAHQTHETADGRAYESNGAHTNLVRTLIQLYMFTMYGYSLRGFSPRHIIRYINSIKLLKLLPYLDIMTTIHDFPENKYGDIPDDGNRNEILKKLHELQYLEETKKQCIVIYGEEVTNRVFKLYEEFNNKSTPIGRALYCADKVAAILYYINSDKDGNYVCVKPDDIEKSATNAQSVKHCRKTSNGYPVAWLWTMDYLRTRMLVRYDESLFFTSVIIMMTIMVYGKWHEKDSLSS